MSWGGTDDVKILSSSSSIPILLMKLWNAVVVVIEVLVVVVDVLVVVVVVVEVDVVVVVISS